MSYEFRVRFNFSWRLGWYILYMGLKRKHERTVLILKKRPPDFRCKAISCGKVMKRCMYKLIYIHSWVELSIMIVCFWKYWLSVLWLLNGTSKSSPIVSESPPKSSGNEQYLSPITQLADLDDLAVRLLGHSDIYYCHHYIQFSMTNNPKGVSDYRF